MRYYKAAMCCCLAWLVGSSVLAQSYNPVNIYFGPAQLDPGSGGWYFLASNPWALPAPNVDNTKQGGLDGSQSFGGKVTVPLPIYTNKVLYYKQGETPNAIKFLEFPNKKIAQASQSSSQRYVEFGMGYAIDASLNGPAPLTSFRKNYQVVPGQDINNGQTITVYHYLYSYSRIKTSDTRVYGLVNSFSLYCEQPQWADPSQIQANNMQGISLANICNGLGAQFQGIKQYFRGAQEDAQRPVNVYLDIVDDAHRITDLVIDQNVSAGQHTLIAQKEYDNGAYDATFGAHSGVVSFTVNFNVLQSPKIIVESHPNTFCSNGTPYVFQAKPENGNYTDGQWSGQGIDAAGNFNPANSGTGTIPLTYTYTAPNGCTATERVEITVKAAPAVSAQNTQVCYGASFDLNNQGSPAGGTFIGPAIESGHIFNSNKGVVGNNQVTYTYTDPNTGCSNSSSFTVTVVDASGFNVGGDEIFCDNSGLINLNTRQNVTPNDGTIVWSSSDPGIINARYYDPAQAGIGIHTITGQLFVNTTGCTYQKNFVVQVIKGPEVSAGEDLTVCQNAGDVRLTGGSPAGGTWAGDLVDNGFFRTSQAQPGNYAVHYVYSNGSCTITKDRIITVLAPPTIDEIPNQVVCNGAAVSPVNFSGAIAGTTYNWTNNAPAIGLDISGAGNIPTFTAKNNTNAQITATVTVTPSANGCTGSAKTFTITVNPTPTVSATANQIVCNNGMVEAINFNSNIQGATFSWQNDQPGIGLPASGNDNIPGFKATNTSTVALIATITVTPSANGCTGIPSTFTITVNPTPTVGGLPNQTICAGGTIAAIPFTGPVSGTTYSWANDAPEIGLAGFGNGDIASFTTINTTSEPKIATISVTPSANGCSGETNTFTITVNPPATVTTIANQVLCNGSQTVPVNFTGPVSGSTYSWSNNTPAIGLADKGTGDISSFIATNATSAPVTATITVTPTANGCTGSPSSFLVTVNPTPVVNGIANQVLCNGSQTIPVNFTGPVSGSTYSWTNNTPAIGLADKGTGNIPSFTATNTTSAPVTATITVTPMANGCTGEAKTFTIIVNPTPVANEVANQVLCNQSPTAPVKFTGAVAGTMYSWTNDVTAIGLADKGTGNIPSFTATNKDSKPITAIFTVTPSANGCTGTTEIFTITVNPTPVANEIANQVLCNQSTATPVSFTGAVAGTVYSWTNDVTTIGLADKGTGNIPSFTATNVTSAPITATITVTPTANGCTGRPVTFTYTVNPTPVVNGVANQVLCNQSPTTPVSFTGAVAGTVYSWTNDVTAIGLADKGTGNIPSFKATNATSAPITATITVTPTANGCTGLPVTFTYTMNPTPVVNGIANQVLCNQSPTSPVNFTGAVAGTVYSWTNSNTEIGLPVSGTGALASFAAVNKTQLPISATITVTPTANGCKGMPITYTYTVNPTPAISLQTRSLVFCQLDQNIKPPYAQPAGTWSSLTGNFYDASKNEIVVGKLQVGNNNLLKYYVLDAKTTCDNADTVRITLNPSPKVSVMRDFYACANGTSVTLTATIDNNSSGYWQGDGVNNNQGDYFVPSSTSIGTHNLLYTATDGTTGCRIVDTVRATVIDTPHLSISADTSICIASGLLQLNATPAGGSWEGNPAVTGTTFNPGLSGVGTWQLTYSYTNKQSGCTSADRTRVTVKPVPGSITIRGDTVVCLNRTITLTASADNVNDFDWFHQGDQQAFATGKSIKYQVTKDEILLAKPRPVFIGDCPGEAKAVQLTMNSPQGTVTVVSGDTLDFGGLYQATSSITKAVSYRWDFNDGGYSNEPNGNHYYYAPGKHSISLVATGSTGCTTTWPVSSVVVRNENGQISDPGFDRGDGQDNVIRDANVFPTAFRDKLTITFNLKKAQSIHLQFFDQNGKMIKEATQQGIVGYNKILFTDMLTSIPGHGVYIFLKISSAEMQGNAYKLFKL